MADDLSEPPSLPLYEADFLAWTEQQEEALRARASGGNTLDWDNLAEEIGDLGRSHFDACESWVERIIEHLFKIELVGSADDLRGWRKEIRGFRGDLARKLTPTIRNRLIDDLERLHARAAREVREDYDVAPPPELRYGWDRIVGEDWYPEPGRGDSPPP